MSIFRKAERRKAKLRLAIDGPSGSGKTLSSLLIAYGIAGDWSKVAVIDTERGSADLYTGTKIPGSAEKIGEYLVATLEPPYSPDRYVECINEARDAGAEVLIIDSFSHAWEGDGGILDIKDSRTKGSSGGNSWAVWRDVTPMHNNMINTVLGSPLHVICTLRTKTEWTTERDEKTGKNKPVKVGLAPVQRAGVEYEFTCVLDMSQEHYATSSKDRTSLFDGMPHVPSIETGKRLLDWLDNGVDPIEKAQAEISGVADVDQLRDVCAAHKAEAQRNGWADRLVAMFKSRQEEIIAGEEGGDSEPPAQPEGASPAPNPEPSSGVDPENLSSTNGEPDGGSNNITIDRLVAKIRACVVLKHLDNVEAKYKSFAEANGFDHVFLAECKARRDEITNTPPAHSDEEVA